jgi:hypothetical protein
LDAHNLLRDDRRTRGKRVAIVIILLAMIHTCTSVNFTPSLLPTYRTFFYLSARAVQCAITPLLRTLTLRLTFYSSALYTLHYKQPPVPCGTIFRLPNLEHIRKLVHYGTLHPPCCQHTTYSTYYSTALIVPARARPNRT